MKRTVNRSELAELLSVHVATIDRWIQEGMPFVARPARKGGSGWQINVGEVLEWHRDRERRSALGDIAAIDEQEARRRKMAAEAALAEHDLALKQGAVVLIEDSGKAWDQMVANARARLLGLGAKLGPMVAIEDDPATCQAMIHSGVQEGLQELSELRYQAEPPDGAPESGGSVGQDSAPVGAAPGSDRKRVGGRRKKAEP